MTRLAVLLLVLALGWPPSSAPQPVPVATRSPAATPGSFPSPAVASLDDAARGSASPTSLPGAIGTPLLGGWATWYRATGNIAAAGPALREHLGKGWRGSVVRVCASRCVTVRLTDWCRCRDRHGQPTLVDLSDGAYRRLAPLSTGVLAVEVEVLGGIDLPETDAP